MTETPDSDLEALRSSLDENGQRAFDELCQQARELAPETTLDEFLGMFGFGFCHRCGRTVDDEDFTDCDIVDDEFTVLCNECIGVAKEASA